MKITSKLSFVIAISAIVVVFVAPALMNRAHALTALRIAHTVNRNGLVGYWTFDDMDSGTSTVKDYSPYGNDGVSYTANGTSGFSNIVGGGSIKNGFNMTGTSFAVIPDSDSLDSLTAMTVEFWINPSSNPATVTYIGRWYVGNNSWIVQPQSGTLKFYTNLNTIHLNSNNTSLMVVNRWQHIVITYDGAAATNKFYYNGASIAATQTGVVPSSLPNATGRLKIGSSSSSGELSNAFSAQGVIDEIRIYNRVLSAAEILYHYTADKQKFRIGGAGQTKFLINK